MNRSALTPTAIGYALLFAVPPGVGLAGATVMVTGKYALAAAAGGIATIVIFLVVVVAVASGSDTA